MYADDGQARLGTAYLFGTRDVTAEQARTQKFLKGGVWHRRGIPPKNCNSIHEMTLLEASTANFRISDRNLHITPVTHQYDCIEVY